MARERQVNKKKASDRFERESENKLLADSAIKLLELKSPQERYEFILDRMLELTNSNYGFVGYIDEKTGYLIAPTLTKDIWDKCQVKRKDVVFKEFTGLWGWVLKNEMPILCNNREEDSRSIPLPQGHIDIENILSVPCVIDNKIAGQITLANKDGGYNERDLKILEAHVPLLSIAIDKHRAESLIKEEGLKMSAIFHGSGDGMRIVDTNFRIIEQNKVMNDLCGVANGEAVGRKCSELFYGEYCQDERCTLRRILAGEEMVRREVVKECPNGWIVPVSLTATAFRDNEGKIIGIIESFRDITKRKKAEEELMVAYEKLKDVDRLKSNILSNVSHELKTPISIMRGCMELAQDVEDPVEREDLLNTGLNALNRQLNIIENFLVTSELGDQGKKEILNLTGLINETLTEFSYDAEIRDIEIKNELSGPEIEMVGDDNRIKLVIRNLLENALKFNRKNGRVFIRSNVENNKVTISVSDTGIGIKPEDLNVIFNPLTQLDPGSSRRFSGTGMGLAASRLIIESHDGKIWAKSKGEDSGSTIFISFPLSK